MSRLNIATEGKAAMSALEWTGRYEENLMGNKIVELDSDDEEDPLRILAQVLLCILHTYCKYLLQISVGHFSCE